jgi:hypothetical protein
MKIQLPHIPDDWDRVATVLLLFLIVAIMFAVSGCTTVSDHGMISFADARRMEYMSPKGTKFKAEDINHSKMAGEVGGITKEVVKGSVIKAGLGTFGDIVGDNIGTDLINK